MCLQVRPERIWSKPSHRPIFVVGPEDLPTEEIYRLKQDGARDGNRTRTARGREILSLLCLPISPAGPACRSDYIGAPIRKRESDLRFPFYRFWSGRRVSNSRPQPWQGCALPTELLPRISWRRGPESNRPTRICNPVHNRFATAPPTNKLCVTAYYTQKSPSFSSKTWSGRRVSNSRPQPWQGCALPTELLPRQTERAL